MTKTKTAKALLASVLALVLCLSMLIGTTFAWFTDSVTSANNIIKSGTLDVEMQWADGKTDPANTTWTDASTGAIFNYDLWEPGYTEVRHIQIANVGSLALKYQLNILANGEVSDLADVIDVYYVDPAVQVENRTALSEDMRIGTLSQVLANVSTTASGNLAAGDKHTITLALKMQETAGNEYQNKSIGSDFSVQLLATQLTAETDSFDDQYDAEAPLDFVVVTSGDELRTALANKEPNIVLANDIAVDGAYTVDYDANIDGAGYAIARNVNSPALMSAEEEAPAVYTGNVFVVKTGTTLTLTDVTVDGGAVWTGEVEEHLGRGTVNSGVQATGSLVTTEGNANVVLGEGAVVQNNYGAAAIFLETRGNGTLTLNGGKILNNENTNGAVVWLGGAAVINDGSVISGNQGTLGGVFRSVDSQGKNNVSVTVNGGSITNNVAPSGGVIWSGNGLTVRFNGGEVAYNHAVSAGGVLWGGSADKYYITGDAEIHHNTAGELGNAFRLNHYKYPTLEMTGGKVYENTSDATPYAFYFINDYVKLSGGEITDDILYTGGVDFTMGQTVIDGVVHFSLDTGHKRILLEKEFGELHFTVADNAEHYSNVHFIPADGYTYAEGDEAKLVCMNDGYSTYWDAATETFRLQAN